MVLRIAVVLIAAMLSSCAIARAEDTVNVKLTFYGYPDNSPPGTEIHWPGPPPRHGSAGGSGTFDNPTTVAVKVGSRWSAGTRMYLPYLQKYLIVEDSCATCGHNHIDVWAGGNGRPRAEVLACENDLTPSGTVPVEIDPPDGRPVSAGTLC